MVHTTMDPNDLFGKFNIENPNMKLDVNFFKHESFDTLLKLEDDTFLETAIKAEVKSETTDAENTNIVHEEINIKSESDSEHYDEYADNNQMKFKDLKKEILLNQLQHCIEESNNLSELESSEKSYSSKSKFQETFKEKTEMEQTEKNKISDTETQIIESENEEAVDQQDLEQITPPAPSPSPSPQPPKSKAKRFKSSTQMPPEAIEGHLMQAVNVMQKMTNNKPGRDDCSLYGELLATRLRAMDELNRELLMHAIDDLVFQTTMKIKRGISPSTISSQSSNSNFQQSEWQAHNSQYQQSFVGINHPRRSHQSMPIPQSLSQMSSASFIGARTSQPWPSQQTPVGLPLYSQHSPSISIPVQLMSPSSSISSCVPTPQQSPSVLLDSHTSPIQPSLSSPSLSIASQNEDDLY